MVKATAVWRGFELYECLVCITWFCLIVTTSTKAHLFHVCVSSGILNSAYSLSVIFFTRVTFTSNKWHILLQKLKMVMRMMKT